MEMREDEIQQSVQIIDTSADADDDDAEIDIGNWENVQR